jgi:hypothetical protein
MEYCFSCRGKVLHGKAVIMSNIVALVALVASLILIGVSFSYLYETGFFNRAYLFLIRTRATVSLALWGFLAPVRVPSL